MTRTHASPDQLPTERLGDYAARTAELDDYYLRFESIPAGFDDRELLQGLPDNVCHSAHWGYVFKGRVVFRYTDGSEDIVEAGEGYYARPGHTFAVLEDAETVEFSPKHEFDETVSAVRENAASGPR